MPAGVAPGRAELFRRVIERILIFRPHDPGLDANGLVRLIELEYSVHVRRHDQRHASPGRPQPEVHRGASPVHVDRYAMAVAVIDDLPYVLLVARMQGGISRPVDNTMAQLLSLLNRFAERVPDP